MKYTSHVTKQASKHIVLIIRRRRIQFFCFCFFFISTNLVIAILFSWRILNVSRQTAFQFIIIFHLLSFEIITHKCMHLFSFLTQRRKEKDEKKTAREKYSLWKQTKCDTLLSVRFCVHSFTGRTSVFYFNEYCSRIFVSALLEKIEQQKENVINKKKVWNYENNRSLKLGNGATSL